MSDTGRQPSDSLDRCRLISLPRHVSERGALTEVQNDPALPFRVRRVFYIYDVPGGAERGGHAHRRDHELVIAASGSFDVEISNGRHSRTFTLRRPHEALYVAPGHWLQMKNFSSGSIGLVLDSDPYTEEDYIRDYDEYLKFTRNKAESDEISVS